MGRAGAFPTVRPFLIREVKARLAVGVVEGFVHGKRAGLRIELQQVKARVSGRPGSDDDAVGFCIPSGPVKAIVTVEFESRDLYWLGCVRNVENDYRVNSARRLNQVMANGQTVIIGFQCDGWSGTWDYTANKGTPEVPVDTWIHSKAGCNPHQWSTNTWHHVQVSYSRDDSGNVTYKAVWFDGAESVLNATVPSAFALGWAPTLLTNFQLDGYLATSGTATAYVDDLTVYRW